MFTYLTIVCKVGNVQFALILLFCQIIEALKSGTASLKGLQAQMSIESVEDAMDELSEVTIATMMLC